MSEKKGSSAAFVFTNGAFHKDPDKGDDKKWFMNRRIPPNATRAGRMNVVPVREMWICKI